MAHEKPQEQAWRCSRGRWGWAIGGRSIAETHLGAVERAGAVVVAEAPGGREADVEVVADLQADARAGVAERATVRALDHAVLIGELAVEGPAVEFQGADHVHAVTAMAEVRV